MDETAFGRRPRLRDRWQAVTDDPRLVVGLTVCALLVLVPVAIVIGILLAGGKFDGGGIAMLVFVAACGIWGVISTVPKSGSAATMKSFAADNGLHHVRGRTAEHYRERGFASGAYDVAWSLQSKSYPLLEVGERIGTQVNIRNPGASPNDTMRVEANPTTGFVRVVLPGRVPARAEWWSDSLDVALARFDPRAEVSIDDDEVTILGNKRLQKHDVRSALDLADLVIANAGEAAVPIDRDVDPRTAPRRARPLRAVLLTLALVIVVPLVFALVMSAVEGTGLRVLVLLAAAVGIAVLTQVGRWFVRRVIN